MRSWVIGSSADCDVVVDSPLASGRHCQLTQTPTVMFERPGLDQRDLRQWREDRGADPSDHGRFDHAGPNGAVALAAGTDDVRPDRPPGR